MYDILARRQHRLSRALHRATVRRTRRYHEWKHCPDRTDGCEARLGEAQDLMYALMDELRGAKWN
jgi:hypothetical protein